MEIPAGQFKNQCLRLMDEVQRTRQEIVITKRGKPIAKLVPADRPARSPWGWMKGTAEIVGDVIAPIDEPWDAQA